MAQDVDPIKIKIISLFNQSVRGKSASLAGGKKQHDGVKKNLPSFNQVYPFLKS